MKQENSASPVQLRFKELCDGFYPYTSVSEQEMKVVSYAGVTFSFNSRMMTKKSWFGWPSTAKRPDMVRREDTKEGSNQRGGGECNSIVFYLSFLTHSTSQYDVT